MSLKNKTLKIALGTPPVIPGAPDFNVQKIKNCIAAAAQNGVAAVAFGQDAIAGPGLADMIDSRPFLDGVLDAVNELIAFSATVTPAIILGFPVELNGAVTPSACVIQGGKLLTLVPVRKAATRTVTVCGKKVQVSADGTDIKDMPWVFSVATGATFDDAITAAEQQAARGNKVILVSATSPALIGSFTARQNRLKTLSERYMCACAYVSTGGAAGNTVYSGDKIVAENGQILTASEGNEPMAVYAEINVYPKNSGTPTTQNGTKNALNSVKTAHNGADGYFTPPDNRFPFVPDKAEFPRVFDIMGRGIYARMREAKAEKLIFGLSGGLDSTIVLLAAEKMCKKYALDSKNILCIRMPGESSSARTKNNAAELTDLLGVSGTEIPIGSAVRDHLAAIGCSQNAPSVVYENAQARERAQILFDLANLHRALVLGTGDLSETALGWSTYGGDQLAHYNPNGALSKTLIRALVRDCAEKTENKRLSAVLHDILATPISPELLKDQDTEKLLGPYELHDFFLYHLIGKNRAVREVYDLAEKTFADYKKTDILKYLRLFISRFFTNQFKRNASCDALRLSAYDLSGKAVASAFSPESFLKALDLLEKC